MSATYETLGILRKSDKFKNGGFSHRVKNRCRQKSKNYTSLESKFDADQSLIKDYGLKMYRFRYIEAYS